MHETERGEQNLAILVFVALDKEPVHRLDHLQHQVPFFAIRDDPQDALLYEGSDILAGVRHDPVECVISFHLIPRLKILQLSQHGGIARLLRGQYHLDCLHEVGYRLCYTHSSQNVPSTTPHSAGARTGRQRQGQGQEWTRE